MAVNTSRSLVGDLHEGMTDGSYRKARPNIGGELVNDDTLRVRRDLLRDNGYGDITTDAMEKCLPDDSGWA